MYQTLKVMIQLAVVITVQLIMKGVGDKTVKPTTLDNRIELTNKRRERRV